MSRATGDNTTAAGAASVDYVVIGGGSAGCVVTQRLVEAGKSVMLLESGPADNHAFIHIPATFVRIIGTHRSFMYRTEPEPGVDGRVLAVPQGRTLGGGSSINAMIYIRGQAQDYDTWRDLGCPGWGYADVLPVFKRSEGNERLAGEFHGANGRLKVSDLRYTHPLSRAFLRAAQEAGYSYNDDFNGRDQAGVGFYQTTTFEGRRGSTAATYLKSVKGNPLLTVRTGCEVTRILIEGGAAVGVAYRAGGTAHEVRTRHEVILTAGAVGSPKVLLLSGIGPGAELARHGISVQHDLPGVGENFQDHIAAPVYGVTDRPISLLGADKGPWASPPWHEDGYARALATTRYPPYRHGIARGRPQLRPCLRNLASDLLAAVRQFRALHPRADIELTKLNS